MSSSRLFAGLAVALTVWGAAAVAGARSATAQSAGCPVNPAELSIDAEEQSALEAINALRASAGLSSLTLAPSLGQAAAHKASLMATTGAFAHDDPGRGWAQRLAECGYRASPSVMENIAYGTETGRATVQMWRDSPAHHQVMLSATMRVVGIARVRSGGGTWYWTADFGAITEAQSTAAPTAPGATPAPPSLQAATPSAAASTPAASLQAGGVATVAAGRGDCLNVRAAPGRAAPPVGCLADGTPVRVGNVTTAADGIAWVQLDGLGWAAAEFLTAGAAAGRAPLTTLPASPRLPALDDDPCLPAPGAGACDVLRLALWLGDADAWTAWLGRTGLAPAELTITALRFRADQGSARSAAVLEAIGR